VTFVLNSCMRWHQKRHRS